MRIKKTAIGKLLIAIILVLFFCSLPTFAVDLTHCSGENGTLGAISIVFRRILNIFSRLWIVLAKLAGTLMTNTILYGQFVNLDVVLWNVWQIIRTFTNYAIGLLFLFYIIRYFFDQTISPKKIIKELLLTSIFVQSSWFLTMAVVDVSTLCLATVSSFPSQVIASSSKIQYNLTEDLRKDPILKYGLQNNKGIVINSYIDDFTDDTKQSPQEIAERTPTTGDSDETGGTDLEKMLIDNLQPTPDSLAGPLIYFGFTLFNVNNDAMLNQVNGENCIEVFTKILINNIINAGAMVLYTVALCVLVFVLIMRVMSIWIFIAISPFACLVYFGESLIPSKLKPSDGGTIGHCFQINKMLKLIFQPVVFGIYISIMFLFVIVLKSFLNTDPLGTIGNGDIRMSEKTDQTNNTKTSTLDIGIVQTSSDKGNDDGGVIRMVFRQGTKSLTEIIISLIALVLMWQLIKLAITSETGIKSLDQMTSKVAKTMSTAIGNIGIIPTPAGSIGWNQLTGSNGKDGLLSSLDYKINTSLNNQETERRNAIREKLGLTNTEVSDLSLENRNKLQKYIISPNLTADGFINEIQGIRKQNGIKFSDAMNYFSEFLKAHNAGDYWGGMGGQNGKLSGSHLDGNFNPDEIFTGGSDGYRNYFSHATYGRIRLKEFYEKILGVTDEAKIPTSYDQIQQANSIYSSIPPEGKTKTS